jgi:crotonobetainyl-CoA:carnitine CoA-transferase CaiB-like acyl-CoA transferase
MAVFTGLRVLDLTDAKGVYGTKLLADMGADVVRVEPPGGDPLRAHPPFLGGVPGAERSLYWSYMNTSKRSVTLDSSTADGRAILDRLVGTAGIVAVSGERARVLELGVQDWLREHEGLIISAITPFGLSGPFQDWSGNDFIAWATGGLMFSTGDPDRPPLSPAPVAELSHILASYLVTFSALAALRARRRGGAGQLVEVSLQQAVLTASGEAGVSAFADDQELRGRQGSRRPMSAPFGHYLTADGAAAVLALMPAHWDALAAWIHEKTGMEGALDESLRGPAFVRSGDLYDVATFFTEELARLYSKQELFEEAQRRGISVTPVNDPASTAADPQLAHRGYWSELEVDGQRIRAPGAPVRYSTIPWSPRRAPRAGEHNAEVYAEIGIDQAELARLRTVEVV